MAELLVMITCLIANAFLSCGEMAFVSLSRPMLREMAKEGKPHAATLLKLRENPERTLSIVQIGITLVGVLAAAVGGASAEEWISPSLEASLGLTENTAEAIAIAMVVLPYTYLSVVVGELVPKSLALRNPFYFARLAAPWFSLFEKILGPMVSFLEWSTNIVLKTFFRKHTKPKADTEERRKDSVRLDSLSYQARQYVLNLASVEKKTVEQIFVPWSSVDTLDVSFSLQTVEDIIVRSGHTRLPVVDAGKIIGMLNAKEFMALRKSGSGNWPSIIRPHIPLQSRASLMSALKMLQDKKNHMAIVYAGETVRGIVTLEDILEEIIGDVFDEDDDGTITRILSSGATRRMPPSNIQP